MSEVQNAATELINGLIQNSETVNRNLISDGYHTFGELYEHRIELYIALCRMLKKMGVAVWKSKTHHDGSSFEGWFVLGINHTQGRQITYHLPMSKWDECKFVEPEIVPEFDGHTSNDVLERLKQL